MSFISRGHMLLSNRLKQAIRQIVAPIIFAERIKARTMGSYGNVMICELETGKWYLRSDAPISNTVTLVIFRNGLRQTRNLDYTIDPSNYRSIIPTKKWNPSDTVIADAGL